MHGTHDAVGPRLALIAAVARNGVIGRDNALPWHLPEDLRHFRALTTGHPIIMGRRTWESLGRPLPQRRNIVVSGNAGLAAPGAEVVPDLASALVLGAAHPGELFVIGGAQLYRAALPRAQRIYLTEVDLAPEGDVHFPQLDPQDWQEIDRGAPLRSATGIGYRYRVLARRPGR